MAEAVDETSQNPEAKATWLQKKLENEIKKKEADEQAAIEAEKAKVAEENAREAQARLDQNARETLLRAVPDTTANYKELEGKIEVEEKEMPLHQRLLHLLF